MARKSKKVDFVNVNNLPEAGTVPAPMRAACYKAGLYARLSEETEENRERATVETQMELLRKFAAEREDMVVAKEYADISCTGTNFERPGFEEMMRDMRDGVIDCIVVKDLSRLGRDYVETGNYIERVFPFFGVRFIAVTDGYDSERPGGELVMPLKNMVNEMYVKDLSRKMKTAYRAKWNSGEFCSGKVPYGYQKEDRHLIPDPETRDVVVRIFEMFLGGTSIKEIGRILSSSVLSPADYKKMKSGKMSGEDGRLPWKSTTVRHILKSEVYAGDYVHNKQKRSKFGQYGKVLQPEEQWVVIRDTHEPLVSREVFGRAQEMLKSNAEDFKRTHGENGFDHARFNLFGGKIVCADCGKVMGFRTEGMKHQKGFFRCKSYLGMGKGACASHKISAGEVETAVFGRIREHMRLCLDTQAAVRQSNTRGRNMERYDIYGKEAERIKRELQKASEVKAGIFEDYKSGLIDGEQYVEISGRYAGKIKELSVRLEEMLKAQEEYSGGYCVDSGWKAVVDRYLGEDRLTGEMVQAFVDKVEVHEDAGVEIHLKYDDALDRLLSLGAERETL